MGEYQNSKYAKILNKAYNFLNNVSLFVVFCFAIINFIRIPLKDRGLMDNRIKTISFYEFFEMLKLTSF